MVQVRPELSTSILIHHSIVMFLTMASNLYLLEQPP